MMTIVLRPVLKRLYKRETDGEEMADINMAGVLQARFIIKFDILTSDILTSTWPDSCKQASSCHPDILAS